jgi:pSer/pThr/pTyr-binding forkhead associated (FHA) protein
MAVLRVRKGANVGTLYLVFSSHRPTVIGREGHADVGLADSRTSRAHARLALEHGVWIVEDLGSANGTVLKGKRVERAPVEDGASLQIGSTLLSFHEREAPPPPDFEVHGAQPSRVLREESGVLVLEAHQVALDRDVRCDVVHSLRPLSEAEQSLVRAAGEQARRLQDPQFVALLNTKADAVLLRPASGTLEDRFDEVLGLPLEQRIEILRQLVDLALERHSWDALRAPLSLRHVILDAPPGPLTSASVRLPGIELSALVAQARGDLPHLAHFVPYLAPEAQAAVTSDGAPPLASCMYNLGAMGYHLLTREAPMGRGSVLEVLSHHKTLSPAPANLVEPAIPEAVAELLAQMLDKDPRRRPRGRQEVLRALLDAAPGDATPIAPLSNPEQAPAPPAAAPGSASRMGTAAGGTPPPAEAHRAPRPRSRTATPSRAAESPAPARAAVPSFPSSSGAVAGAPTVPTAPPPAARGPRDDAKPGPSVLASVLYLPLWLLIAVICFYAARYVSKSIFQALGS